MIINICLYQNKKVAIKLLLILCIGYRREDPTLTKSAAVLKGAHRSDTTCRVATKKNNHLNRIIYLSLRDFIYRNFQFPYI